MNRRFSRFLPVCLACLAMSVATAAEDESKEPPLSYSLTVNGKPVPMELGKEQTISGEFKDPKVKLEAAATRLFKYAGIQFEYPAGYGWDTDLDETSKTWTLDGDDFQLTVATSIGQLKSSHVLQALSKQFNFPMDEVEKTERTLGGVKYQGGIVKASLGDIAILLEVVEIPMKTGALLLTFQDMELENGKPGKEATETLKLLEKTFRKSEKKE